MSPAAPEAPVLALRGLTTEFGSRGGAFRVLDGVTLTVPRGRTLALVGESGSGKSVTGLSIMRLLRPPRARIVSGEILFRGRDGLARDLARLGEPAMRRLRGNDIAMIFQEPMTSLNPTQTVGWQIAEALRLHQPIPAAAARVHAVRLLRLVEIADAGRRVDLYPHQMSGGMRQRVMIAMALACGPSLLVGDEPTTALDVTVQAQVLRLLRRLQQELGMGILFITHDLGVVAEIADQVAVLYGGQVMESAPVETLFEAPRHPYTRGLMASLPLRAPAAPATDAGRRRLPVVRGSVVDLRAPPPGCRFAPRCDFTLAACEAATPAEAAGAPAHQARCLRWRELA